MLRPAQQRLPRLELLARADEGDDLGVDQRVARARGEAGDRPLQDTFDLPFMAEKSLGLRWKALGDADRTRWIAVFGDFTVASYAANFDHYTGQSFEVLGEEPAASGTRLVRTRVVVPGADSVDFAYRLRPTGDRWAIVDVYLKGTVSELALRRSDYASALEREGFDGLLATMHRKIADLAAGRGKREGM